MVADEVRKLAERSQRETKSISELIRDVQSGTREAVAAIEQGTLKVTEGSAEVASSEPVPPPLTNSRSACSRTAATARARRSTSSGIERDCIQRLIAPSIGLPFGRLATPAICASYDITPTSRNPGRSARYAASASTSALLSTSFGMCAVGFCDAGSSSHFARYARSYLAPTRLRSGAMPCVPYLPTVWHP